MWNHVGEKRTRRRHQSWLQEAGGTVHKRRACRATETGAKKRPTQPVQPTADHRCEALLQINNINKYTEQTNVDNTIFLIYKCV